MNLPNQVTMARVFMTLMFVALLSVPRSWPWWHRWIWEAGYVLGVLAGVTDYVDGMLARRYGLHTEFGALMDPLSDKVQVTAGFVLLTEKGIVPAWMTFSILAREFAVSGLREMAAGKGLKIRSSKLGKLKTLLQMTALLIAGARVVEWIPDGYTIEIVWRIWISSTLIITTVSGAQYFFQNTQLYAKDL